MFHLFNLQNNMISDMPVLNNFQENCKTNVCNFFQVSFMKIRQLGQLERALENRFSVVYL